MVGIDHDPERWIGRTLPGAASPGENGAETANRKDHSEVGSSYIHFNYTPNQDKASASLLGDVPRGVMLREPPMCQNL
jgi:hypothetical protein